MPPAPPVDDPAPTRPYRAASAEERDALERLRGSTSWPRRALVALRLERYDCPESRAVLHGLLEDDTVAVQCFALRALARRNDDLPAGWTGRADDPRVIRCLLRHRFPVDPARVDRGVRRLAKQPTWDERMLAVEIGAASDDAELLALARETCRTIILRMDRATAGTLSSRLGRLTGHRERRDYRWRRWLMRVGRSFELQGGHEVPAERFRDDAPPTLFTEMDGAAVVRFERYLQDLAGRELDLGLVIDCTASMAGELAEVQSGSDDLVLFLGAVLKRVRIGVVAYRDRRAEFETKVGDLTEDLAEARRRLWTLTAEGGGDSAEAVWPALRRAYTELSWDREHAMVLVLIGDGPPHPGYGERCRQYAAEGAKAGLVTHVIEAENRPVKHFAAIAEAGGGRCVTLADDDALMTEIAGLTLADAFEEELRVFYGIYLDLCR